MLDQNLLKEVDEEIGEISTDCGVEFHVKFHNNKDCLLNSEEILKSINMNRRTDEDQ